MRRLSKHRLIYSFIASLFITLALTQCISEQPDGIPLDQAIEKSQVTMVVRGVANQPIFTEPMLQVELTNESSSAITIVIPQGLILTSQVQYANVVTLRMEEITLLPKQPIGIGLFAYSLEYDKNFPLATTEYQIQAML